MTMKKVALAVHANKNFELEIINNLHGLDYIHVDVADGKFTRVRNLDLEVFKIIKSMTDTPLIAHMMVLEPLVLLDKIFDFIEIYTFHFEVEEDIEIIIREIRKKKKLVGIAINPNTPISKLVPFLDEIDLILVMSVYPGESGQEFISETVQKVQNLSAYQENHEFLIDVDGGINVENAKLLKANIVSSTSSILNATDPNLIIRLLKS
jgi:ribulose-phosphate 3-epimerase